MPQDFCLAGRQQRTEARSRAAPLVIMDHYQFKCRRLTVNSHPEIRQEFVTMNIIWFAIFLSLGIYLFLAQPIAQTQGFAQHLAPETFELLRTVLYSIAAITLIMTRYLRNSILPKHGDYTLNIQPGSRSALVKYKSAMVIALALSESIGIYGLVLFCLGGEEPFSMPF